MGRGAGTERNKGANGFMRVIRNTRKKSVIDSPLLELHVNGGTQKGGAGDDVGKLLRTSPAERANTGVRKTM